MADNNKQWKKLRAKKLSQLIHDSRMAANRTPDDCAAVLEISPRQYKSYEKGIASPSLPELEALAFYLDISLDHFWEEQVPSGGLSDDFLQVENLRRPIRDRIIATQIRQCRKMHEISLRQLGKATSISASRIKLYEMAEQAIPIPELEILCSTLQIPLEDMYDRESKIGSWRKTKQLIMNFQGMDRDKQEFITDPQNQEFMELAMKIKQLPEDSLQRIQEIVEKPPVS